MGRERRVEGVLASGDRVLMIDDLVTTGLTLKQACDAVRAEGGIVTEAVAFFDREEGGRQLLEQNGIKLHALLKISEIANTLFEIGAIRPGKPKNNTKTSQKEKALNRRRLGLFLQATHATFPQRHRRLALFWRLCKPVCRWRKSKSPL